jgi:hypothetical protein
VAKLALPAVRLRIMRPAMVTTTGLKSSASRGVFSCLSISSAAKS